MIISFKSRSLKKFYEKGVASQFDPKHINKIADILTMLDAAIQIEDMDVITFNLHKLKGNKNNYWSVTVRSNWRIIFKFENAKASDVDYLDYH